jgi:hypothetical protein
MRKESPNGGANQWLANVERRVVLTLALGKEVVKEEASADVTLFIGEGEREREEVAPVLHIGVRMPATSRTVWTMTRCWVPYLRSLIGGPQSVFSNPA